MKKRKINKKNIFLIALALVIVVVILLLVPWNKENGISQKYSTPGIIGTCRDTDGGANPYEKGRVTIGTWWTPWSSKTYTDTCKDAYSLTEYYCKLGNVKFKYFNADSDIPCDYCLNGACAIPPPSE